MTAIQLDNVTVAYDGRDVIHGLDLSITKGQFCGIIGTNWSCKSTLHNTMNGTLRPREGTVRIDGRDLSQMKRRRIAQLQAVVPQETVVAFPFTVGEIVLMGRAPHMGLLAFEGEKDLAAVREALEETETEAFVNRLLSELSGGEKQRVIIARALAQEAEQLLLDEPTSFLDLKHQVAIYGLIRRLNREREITVVAVSHDVNLAAQFCGRLVLISDGRVFADGSPAEVLTEANIREVYGTPVVVGTNERTGTPWVMPCEVG